MLWGTGKPRREYPPDTDFADTVVFALEFDADTVYSTAPDGRLNVGVVEDAEIPKIAEIIREVVSVDGEIARVLKKPYGTPGECMAATWMHEPGWRATTRLRDGFEQFCGEYGANA